MIVGKARKYLLNRINFGEDGIEMSKIAVFFAEGYEEIEALTVVDICRRSNIVTDMVSVTGEANVKGSHGINVEMDKLLSEVDFGAYDCIVLPGGMPGTLGLEACQELMEQVDAFYKEGKMVAAICAAPSIFGHRGILKGRRACCYPSFESHLEGAEVTAGPVEVSGNVITSRGMGTAIPFSLAIVEKFCGSEAAEAMGKSIIWN